MKNYLVKGHFSIMKSTAIRDYETIKMVCKSHGIEVIEPSSKSWQKIEDATAEMLRSLPEEPSVYLNRGLEYYRILNINPHLSNH